MAQQLLSGIGSLRPINAETYTTQTYNFLRAAILRRELKEGEVYSQDQISAMLNVSRTPVREALLALQKEGYVRFLRGRGFEVVPQDEKEVGYIAEARMIVEKGVAGLAARRVSERQIERMAENIAAQESCIANSEDFDGQLFIQLDEMFHREILEASDNTHLSKITDDMRSQWVRSGYMIVLYSNHQQEILREHKAIYEAICARDAAAAEQAMAEHLGNTKARRSK